MSRFTVDELHNKYGFKDELTRDEQGVIQMNPIYRKWLPACWIIENIYGHVEAENMSLGKAREITSAVIDEMVSSIYNLEIMELKAENDSLRLALSDKTEELNEVKSSRAVTGERCIELDDENHRLRESLSGKTQYDQVEVEMERLRVAVKAEIARYEKHIKELSENPMMQFAAKDFEREAYEIGLLSGKCEWFLLELLSSPVSGDADKTK